MNKQTPHHTLHSIYIIITIEQKVDFNISKSFVSFSVFPFPVSEWGWQREEGKWSGALGKVHDEEADFSLCASRFEFDRAKYFHYPLNLHYEM